MSTLKRFLVSRMALATLLAGLVLGLLSARLLPLWVALCLSLAACLIIAALFWREQRAFSASREQQRRAMIEWLDRIDVSSDRAPDRLDLGTADDAPLVDAIEDLIWRIHDYRNKLLARHQRVQRLMRNVTDVLYHTDAEGKLRWVSQSVTDMLGFSPADLDGYPLKKLLVDPTADLSELLESERIERRPTRVYRQDGSFAWLLVSSRRLDDSQGKPIGSEGVWRDGTRLIETQRQLDAEKERAQVTLTAIGDGVLTTDAHGIIDYVNPRARQILSLSQQIAPDQRFDEICRLWDPENNQSLSGLVERCLKTQTAQELSHSLILNDEHSSQSRARRWVTVNVSPILNAREQITGAVVVLHDVTRLQRISRELTYQANHDALTGLLNRRAFEQKLHSVLDSAREHGTSHALCYIDLDQFKLVNDSCGHHAGDAMLRQISSRIIAELRPDDVLSRLGGDEFGVILENTPLEAAERIAERLRAWIEGFRFQWQSRTFRLGASIGLAHVHAESLSTAELLRQADTACYLAKERGRNRVQIFRYDSDEARMRDYEIERMQQISEALDNTGFDLFAQAIYPTEQTQDGQRCFSLELLLRINAKNSEATPQSLLLTAERYNVAPRIDRWVINSALTLIAERQHDLPMVSYYSINISGQSITDEHFVDFVRGRIESSGVDPRRLVFEITETAAVTNLQRAGELMRTLRHLGCRFALDDFGSGLSSFSYLKHLPSDLVKLDGQLIHHIVEDPVEHSIVEAIGRVSKALGLLTVAEHVETREQFDALKQIGIDYVQGYYIGRPAPFRQFDAEQHVLHYEAETQHS